MSDSGRGIGGKINFLVASKVMFIKALIEFFQ